MAYTSGTATDYKNLIAILATFAAANGWTVLEQTTNLLWMRGQGLAGTDEIYVGIQTYEDTGNGYYNWELFGAISWRSGRAPEGQPKNSGDDKVFTYLWNSSIPYWIVANPRRIILVAKVGTVYQFVHLGLLTPLGTDAQYPYPLLIGGCGSTKNQSYSAGNSYISAFWNTPQISGSNGMLRLPNGAWAIVGSSGGSVAIPQTKIVSETSYTQIANLLSSPDGSYVPEQFFIVDSNRSDIYGEIDGLFRVSGFGNSSENIITISGVNYMSFQDTFRSGNSNFCALRLN